MTGPSAWTGTARPQAAMATSNAAVITHADHERAVRGRAGPKLALPIMPGPLFAYLPRPPWTVCGARP
jgi:hypothetical protein